MSRTAKYKVVRALDGAAQLDASAKAQAWMQSAEDADRTSAPEAKARIEHLERSGTPGRMKHLDEMRRRLDALYPIANSLIKERAHRYLLLIHRMIDDVAQSEDHHYNPRDEIEANFLWREIMTLRDIVPKAIIGEKFRLGRKPRSGRPIRMAIAILLKKNPTIKNAELWRTLSGNPPRGWKFFDNQAGKYIDGPKGGDGLTYARFRNVASEERKHLKG